MHAAVAALVLACSELPADLLVIAPPHFGAGTAEFRIVVGHGVDLETLEVALDGAPVSDRFQPVSDRISGPGSTTEIVGMLPIAAGEHELSARGSLIHDPGEATYRLAFVSPSALEVIDDSSADGAASLALNDWIPLDLAAPATDEAIDSLGFSCAGGRRKFSLHSVGDRRIVIDPREPLPPDSQCRVVWRGLEGPRERTLRTRTAGPTPTVLYDRRASRQLAPFPDDFWLATNPDTPSERGIRLRAAGFGLPDQWLINALATGVRPLDGFSPLAHYTLALSDAADAASLPSSYSESLSPDASVLLFDVTPDHPDYGARIPFRIQARSEESRGETDHALLVFPSVALEPAHRYGLVVTRRVRSLGGASFGPSAFLAEIRDASPSPETWLVDRARVLFEEVSTAASAASIPIERADIAFAARFTIRSLDGISDDLAHIQQATSDAPPPTLSAISIKPAPRGGVDVLDTGGRTKLAAIVRGRFRASNWLDGSSRLARDPETNLPSPSGMRDLRFTLALPRAALDGPVPLVMYQHGNPGSAEEEVVRHANSYLAEAGFAVIGFDDVLNRQPGRSRLSMNERASRQVAAILVRIIASSSMPDFFAQTIADQLAFVRAIEGITAIGKFHVPFGPNGRKRTVHGIDPAAPLLYLGVSEGAHHGAMLLPFAPQIRAAVLISPGRRFSEVLIHQGSEQLLTPLYSLGFGKLRPADLWVTLALIQMIFDDQDSSNFARFLYREPLDVSPAPRPSVLMIEGLEDSLVPNHATHALARSIGPVVHLAPASRPVDGLEVAADSVAGNVDARTTAALYQYVPEGVAGTEATPGCSSPPLSANSAQEGHYCAQSAAESIWQRVAFLRSALEDEIPRVSDPLQSPGNGTHPASRPAASRIRRRE